MLKPQDIVVAVKVYLWEGDWTYQKIAAELAMSASEVHGALRRCSDARLYFQSKRRVRTKALRELLVHGVRYVYPVHLGELTRGLPTAHSHEALAHRLPGAGELETVVWADPAGPVVGRAIKPLYRSVPEAARTDALLHAVLALVDGIRLGPPGDRDAAIAELDAVLADDQAVSFHPPTKRAV